ncbi:MAG: hypothetical protein WCK86_01360, partial [Planctomycetia bacterium]
TLEQLAGDLLPNPTEDQQIATAFHRNTMTNNEGGTSDEEFRNVGAFALKPPYPTTDADTGIPAKWHTIQRQILPQNLRGSPLANVWLWAPRNSMS